MTLKLDIGIMSTCNGSAQPGPISQYAPSSRPTTHAARRPNVRDRRQTDRGQTASSFNAPWAVG